MARRCTCDQCRIGDQFTPDQCRECWLYHNNENVRNWLDHGILPDNAQPTSAPTQFTIGMPTYDDYAGVAFTLTSLRLHHAADMEGVELLVVDNFGCERTKKFCENWGSARYILAKDCVGSAPTKNRVFSEANGNVVLCVDGHVLLAPGAIRAVKEYFAANPDSKDMLAGPMIYDDARTKHTHFQPGWVGFSPGTWAADERGNDPANPPFEIPMHGCGFMAMRKTAWPGFHPAMRGFGGEEGYIHERVRQCGGKVLCHPACGWWHFFRNTTTPYPNRLEDQLRNYLIGWMHIGLSTAEVVQQFSAHVPESTIAKLVDEAKAITLTHQVAPKDAPTLRCGDAVAVVAKLVGADRAAKLWEKWTGTGCGCADRQEAMNTACAKLEKMLRSGLDKLALRVARWRR